MKIVQLYLKTSLERQINEILVQPLITSLAMTDEDDSFSIARDLSVYIASKAL